MWVYEKKLLFPVKIKNPNANFAKVIVSQLGKTDVELGAATRYLSQRFNMPDRRIVGILTDIGTEELAHVEIVSTILYQLTRNLCVDDIIKDGFDTYFGIPFNTAILQFTGDVFADLHENLAAEQKARFIYDNILRLADDPDVIEPIKFLRAREIVHYQRFGDALAIAQDNVKDKSNFYAYNQAFDN